MSRSLACGSLSLPGSEHAGYAVLACLCSVRRQRVQIRIRRRTPSTRMVTGWTFGLNLRFVLRFEWLTLCPNPGFFPQSSQVATGHSSTQVVESHTGVRSVTISTMRTCRLSLLACRVRHRSKPSTGIATLQTAAIPRTRRATSRSCERQRTGILRWVQMERVNGERVDRKGLL